MLQNSGQFWDHSLFGCLFFTRYLHFESSKLFHYNFDISKRVVLRIKTNKSNPECFSSADQHPESFSGHTAAHWSSVGPLASPPNGRPTTTATPPCHALQLPQALEPVLPTNPSSAAVPPQPLPIPSPSGTARLPPCTVLTV